MRFDRSGAGHRADPRVSLRTVASAFSHLLEATLAHLQSLKEAGVREVEVDPATLQSLRASPSIRPARLQRPPPPSAPVAATGAPAEVQSKATPRPVAPAADKASTMQALREEALGCQNCPHLVRSRTQVVFGVGTLEAELMFIGEAPGADEDRLGEPFVGRAGQLLTRIIQAMGESRETVYIANILKCRPDLPPGSRGNRPPRADEMDTCKPYLLRQIEIIQPKVLVALGTTAVQGLLGPATRIGSVRGRWQTFQGIPLMPTFHPSYLLRAEDAADRGHSEKRKTWEDMLQVLDRLGKPISDKMRGYFLKAAGSRPGSEAGG